MSRQERLNELIKEELSQIILREMDLESGNFITVMDVDISSDFKSAKILLSIFPQERSQEIFGIIKKRQPFFQALIKKRLQMRHVPYLKFDLIGR